MQIQYRIYYCNIFCLIFEHCETQKINTSPNSRHVRDSHSRTYILQSRVLSVSIFLKFEKKKKSLKSYRYMLWSHKNICIEDQNWIVEWKYSTWPAQIIYASYLINTRYFTTKNACKNQKTGALILVSLYTHTTYQLMQLRVSGILDFSSLTITIDKKDNKNS